MSRCDICGDVMEVWFGGGGSGNNASPVVDGRCCDNCNAVVVIPARLRDMDLQRKNRKEVK